MDAELIPLAAVALREAFPVECVSVSDRTLYNLLSLELTPTKPNVGEYFNAEHALEILKAAAPYVPLVVAIVKGLLPEQKRTEEDATRNVMVVVLKSPESKYLEQKKTGMAERLVRACVAAIFRASE